MLVFHFILVLVFSSYVSADDISLVYPLEDQLPPIARVGDPFSWTISRNTFVSASNHTLQYSSGSLPHWLAFDDADLVFHGTPTRDDKGSQAIQLTAKDSSDSATSRFNLFVTDQAGPTLQHSIVEQFQLPNPSLSSVFSLAPHSALRSKNPALRIPPGWSFSIGFQYDTFTTAGDDLYYAASMANGEPIPDWMVFNPRSITFNGYTPKQPSNSAPYTISLALHGSDQEGYSASSLLFDVVVAAHELSLATPSLPTINITADNSFSVSLTSPVDFTGVLLDGKQIQPSDITAIQVDTSYYSWLTYDTSSRTLSGDPPKDLDDGTLLPVTLTTNINQTLETNVSLAVVPPFFTSADLKPILVNPGQAVNFSLSPFYSNNSGITVGSGPDSDVNLTAAYDPKDASDFLTFDVASGLLSGNIPTSGGNNYSHIGVTFTAYSRITHSTSHASLPISLSASDFAHQQHHASGLSAAARAKMLLGIKISFSIIGGLLLFGLFLAGMRRCTRVPDTALQGEEGRKAWTEEEKRWYGLDADGHSTRGLARLSRAISRSISSMISPRIPSHSPKVPPEAPLSPGVMKKGIFLGKIRQTAGRKVSSTVKVVGNIVRSIGPSAGTGATKSRKPIISKPVLMMHNNEPVHLTAGNTPSPRHPEVAPFEDLDFSQYAPSGLSLSIAGSPSSSTGDRSIPRRRADFAPPNVKSPEVLTTPPQVYRGHRNSIRRRSVDLESLVESMGSRSAMSVQSEAAIMNSRGEKSMSMRSYRSVSAISVQSVADARASHSRRPSSTSKGGKTRPRLVPFTSSSRVPVPKMPSSYFTGDVDPAEVVESDNVIEAVSPKSKRVVSQMAKVFRSASTDRGLREGKIGEGEGSTGDELSVGIQYVKALGADDGRLPVNLTTTSFSVESSMHAAGDQRDSASIMTNTRTHAVPRMLARTGEQFKFRVPLTFSHLLSPTSSPAPGEPLEVKLMSGLPLPRFVRTNVDVMGKPERNGGGSGRMVEFTGVPSKADVGELNVAVYMKSTEECVGRVIIEIVERAK
ncbi:hypothetical protein BXZ70DRAFT_1012416 [Cristinia sonorae]|uniref:Dystroglycan-type cadherin-like domain-containing protein n=1 Tax=Cristinia sonorae TaxID=1940300 RepID=A0A8K0XKK4_9AGAR|nr:hypothetical protein BXZ70DRAFT_1012416 [Cristinia sonorae]